MKSKDANKNPLRKRAHKGFRGFPIATIAFYGPNDQRASKVVVGIVTREGAGADILERWHAEGDSDLRFDHDVGTEITAFVREHKALSVVMADRIIGCPHEEGVDYEEGKPCPECPFWSNRDRFTGELIH